MDTSEVKPTSIWCALVIPVYTLIAINLLWRLFVYVIQAPFQLSLTLAVFLTLLSIFPIRNKLNGTKQGTFSGWVLYCVVITALIYFFSFIVF